MLKHAKIVIALALSFLLLGCGSLNDATTPGTQQLAKPPQPPPPPQSITITAVGDFLMHMPVIQSAKLQDGTYDFKPIFTEVKDLLGSNDLTIANLETRLAGKEHGFSGYPVFNCPAELAYNMKELGIDVVTTANNHSLDRGWLGIVNTLENLEAAGLHHVGTYRSSEESERVFIIDVKGIKVGILNYAENTNGIPLPKGKEFAVDLINSQKLYRDITKLKAQGSDVIVAYLHFGTEYQRYPNELQSKLVENLFQQGVDIVFGDHVHVIQPMDLKTFGNGEKQHFVVYSLGNFISNQSWRYSNCGLIANVELQKADGEVTIKKIDYVPVWVDTYMKNGQKQYRVIPVQKALEDFQANTDPLLTRDDYVTLQEVWQDTTSLISKACPVISPKNLPGGSKI